MHPKKFALVMGIVFLVLGAFAFKPSLSSIPVDGLPALYIENSYGAFLDRFAMNIVNKVALIAFGLYGIWAYNRPATSLPASITFARTVFYVMGTLAVLGWIPETNTLFGYWPLFGNNAWLHAFFAVTGGYFGYALTSRVPPENQLPGRDRYATATR